MRSAGPENRDWKTRPAFFGAIATILAFVVAPSAFADETRYIYDALGRLVRVEKDDGSYVEYAYDAADNRVSVHAVGGSRKVVVVPLIGLLVIPLP